MNGWPAIREGYFGWLRTFPMLTNIGQPAEAPEVIPHRDAPVYLNSAFWSRRTHEIEARAREHLTDPEIDPTFNEVAAVIDENLGRFDPLIAYFARFFPDGHPERIEDERDTAWAAVERAIGEPGFFTALLPWYERGRWPCDWSGEYRAGHVLVL